MDDEDGCSFCKDEGRGKALTRLYSTCRLTGELCDPEECTLWAIYRMLKLLNGD